MGTKSRADLDLDFTTSYQEQGQTSQESTATQSPTLPPKSTVKIH